MQSIILVYFVTIWSILHHWKYFMAIWYFSWSFGIFIPILVFCTKKNLATLVETIEILEIVSTHRWKP
jgi:hypothetical protein